MTDAPMAVGPQRPLNWSMVELSDVAAIDRNSVAPDEMGGHELYVGLENITSGGEFESVATAGEAGLKSNKFMFSGDHILYGKLRPYLAKIAAPEFEGICSTDILPIKPGGSLDRRYLLHYLRTPEMVDHAANNAVGINLPRLNPKTLESFEIPLPPVEEQQRIAAVLDAADALRAKRRQALAKLDSLTQAIFISMFGGPIQNEHGWPTAQLGEIACFVRGITFKPEDVVDAGEADSIICLRTKNVQEELDLDDLIAVAPKFVKRQEQYLQTGDVLISSANSWNLVGKCCWIPELQWPTSFGGFVTVLRPTTEIVHRRYLFEWFRHQHVQQLLRSFGRKTTNISNLNLDRCRSMDFPLPPPNLQSRFVKAVEGIQSHRERITENSHLLDALFASLQQRAFRGEL